MTAPVLARLVLARLVRPRTLARWGGAIGVGLGVWALLSLWWQQDLDGVGLRLVSAALVMGLAGSVAVLLASDVVRLALAAGATRRRILTAWVILAPAILLPALAVVVAGVAVVAGSWGWVPASLVPLALVGTTVWLGGPGLLAALASESRAGRRIGAPALLLLALASMVGAGATAFDPVPGWVILGVALAAVAATTVPLVLRTPAPPAVAGLLSGPAPTRKVSR